MKCQELDRSGIPEKYLIGQLEPAAQDEFEFHILECPSCQRTLELLQTVRDDLVAHADEVRAYSPAPRMYLRWAWIATSGLVFIAGGTGVQQVLLRRLGSGPVARNASPVVSSPAAKSPGTNPELASGSGSDSGVQAAVEGRRGVQVRLPHAPNESAAGAKAELTNTTDNLPLNARDQVNSANGGPGPHESAPAVQPNSETVAQATVEKEPENKTVGPSVPHPAASSDSISAQIAKLVTVRPFPYTFARLGSSQPSSGGSARAQHQSDSRLSGDSTTGVTPGVNGFSTAQDYFRQGMSAYVSRNYETAVNLLTQAVLLQPNFSEANLYLGICKLLQGSPSEAASALQIAVKIEKKAALSQAAHYFLGKAYLQLGKPADAESEFRVAAALPGRLAGESNQLMQRLDDIRGESARK